MDYVTQKVEKFQYIKDECAGMFLWSALPYYPKGVLELLIIVILSSAVSKVAALIYLKGSGAHNIMLTDLNHPAQ